MSITYPRSLSLICPAEYKTNVDKLMEALDRGPNTMSISLWEVAADPEEDEPTWYGAHTFDDELGGIITSDTLPSPLYLGDVELTEQEAQEALESIRAHSVPWTPGDSAVENFTVLLNYLGLKRAV